MVWPTAGAELGPKLGRERRGKVFPRVRYVFLLRTGVSNSIILEEKKYNW
jgi:hypothetical protein